MKYWLTLIVLVMATAVPAQNKELTADSSISIPVARFDKKGELLITASPHSSPGDFDFLIGKWKMYHRRINTRLAHGTEWTEFESDDENHKILNNTADVDTYSTTQMPGIEGKRFEGFTLRLFDQKTKLWRLYWVASNTGVLDPPMVGSFDKNGIGHFFCKDKFNGKNILVLFRWDARNKQRPVWSQAFSPDNGKTWEWNWFNVSVQQESHN